MFADQHFEFGDDLFVTTDRKLRLNQLLPGIESKLVESCDRPLCEGLVGEFGQRWPAPEGLRLGEVRCRVLGATRGERPAPELIQPLEPVRIELVQLQLEDVTGRPVIKRSPAVTWPDVDVRRKRARRARPSPVECSPQTWSTSRSTETSWFGWIANTASTAR